MEGWQGEVMERVVITGLQYDTATNGRVGTIVDIPMEPEPEPEPEPARPDSDGPPAAAETLGRAWRGWSATARRARPPARGEGDGPPGLAALRTRVVVRLDPDPARPHTGPANLFGKEAPKEIRIRLSCLRPLAHQY